METNIVSFVALIDHAVKIAKRRLAIRESGLSDPAPPGALENIIRALERYRDDAVSRKLEPSGGIITTGLLREVADWGEPSDSELLKAVQALERYHLENM